MQKQSMSITRALAIRKSLKKEIADHFNTQRLLVAIQLGNAGKDTNIVGQDAAKVVATIQSNHDKIHGMLRRFTAIRQAINDSNHNTQVVINGVTMSVSDAIVMKDTMEERKKILSNYRIALHKATQEVEKITEKFDSRIDALVAANIDDDTSTEERTRVQQSIRESQTNMFGPRLLDPLDIRAKITEMEDEITFLTTEFDYVLSTSNTVTMIEVEV